MTIPPELASFSILDYLIIIYLIYHSINGFRKGFIRLLIETIAIVATLAITISYHQDIAQLIQTHYSLSNSHSIIISIFLIAVLIFMGSWIINKCISFIITISGLGLINRLTGSFLGVIKGLCILIPLMIPLLWATPSLIQNSTLLFKARQLMKQTPTTTKQITTPQNKSNDPFFNNKNN